MCVQSVDMSYHELTEKLGFRLQADALTADDKIRYWLEEKAQEFELYVGIEKGKSKHNKLREILGLTKKEEMADNCTNPSMHPYHCVCPPESFNKKESPMETKTWCCDKMEVCGTDTKEVKFMHKNGKGGCAYVDFKNIKFCPFCGSKRPERPKALWERLRKETFCENLVDDETKKIANAALDAVLEVVESLDTKFKGGLCDGVIKDTEAFKDELKHRLEALRGGE